MKLPEVQKFNFGLSTIGITGNVILAGVIFGSLNPWWLILASLLILSGAGSESITHWKK